MNPLNQWRKPSVKCHMEFKRKFNMEDSPPCLVQSLLTGCSNQRQVRTPPRPVISQGITFKDLLHGRHRSEAVSGRNPLAGKRFWCGAGKTKHRNISDLEKVDLGINWYVNGSVGNGDRK
ncbi:hypothetical protein ATANTOWER_012940 [Ataeniobius toweri]|uniref:Uncharacterized protein n=1 Tax=Ataeniobius toweri TaxID=208326 RepID=A0ABU7CKA7_9TELE|nr:hypothetical protein [Ataeniobius toweri]